MPNARVLLLVLLCALLAPSTAAASVTLGPANPNPDPGGSQAINWPTGALLFTATAPAGVQLFAPTDGVITRWLLYTDDVIGEGATAQLRTLSPAGSKSYAVTGAGSVEPLPPVTPEGSTIHNVPHAFSARLPIAAGQIIGVSLTHATPGTFVLPVLPVGLGWEYGCLGPGCASEVPTDGKPVTATQIKEQWLAMNAQFEPDVDRDGYGDETQDPCVGVCPPVATLPSTTLPGQGNVKKKPRKCGKGKKLKRGKCVRKHKKKHRPRSS